MDDFIQRQLLEMRNSLQGFKEKNLSLSNLVNKLSGLLDALRNHTNPWTNRAIQNEVNELEVVVGILAARKESKVFFWPKRLFWWEKRGVNQSVAAIEKSLTELLVTESDLAK